MTSASPAAEQGFAIERNGKREVLYRPFPHQQAYHASTAKYFILEGGGGSGKSKCMRWDAYMRCLTIPRFKALLVRRSVPELRKSHLVEVPFEAKQMGLPDDAWHATLLTLRFPNGSFFEFGHVEDEQSLTKYLSSEYDLIIFDELATFTLKQFKFLSSRARTVVGRGVTPFIRGGTNPVGVGAGWVRRYFITKRVKETEDPEYNPKDYQALKCTLRDNPALDRDDYAKTLNSLPSEALRRAMLDGEWVIEGQFFSEWGPQHVIQTPPMYRGRPIWFAPHIEIVRVLDWGYSKSGNPGCCLWFACLTDGSAICFQEYYFTETLPRDVAREIKRMSAGLKVRYTVGDTAMWQEHEGPSIAEQLAKHGLGMIEADKERVAGWVEVHTLLRDTVTIMTEEGPREVPKLRFYEPGCPEAVRTIPDQVIDPNDPNDIKTDGVEDDAADDVRYFAMSRPGRSKPEKQDPELSWIRRQIAKKRRSEGRLGSEGVRRRAA